MIYSSGHSTVITRSLFAGFFRPTYIAYVKFAQYARKAANKSERVTNVKRIG